MIRSIAPIAKHTVVRMAAVLACALGAGSAFAAPQADDCAALQGFTPDRVVFAVTQKQALVSFHTCRPGKEHRVGAISGLQGADTAVIGVDFRVQDGLLYAVGNGGGIYTVDTASAVLTKASQLTQPLSGTHFGVNFNPAANALRIVSDNGQNLRHPFVNPEPRTTFVDTPLSQVAGTTATGVTAVAYTNNDLDASTNTFLFDIDATQDQLVVQAPANNGLLTQAGKLGLDAGSDIGFDIYTHVVDGVSRTNTAFASFDVAGVSAFYRLNLTTGRPTQIGTLAEPLVAFSIELDK